MKIKGIVFHWTEGDYEKVFENYHYNITYNRETEMASVVKTCINDFEEKDHTWHRNNGRIGISLCCACGSTPEDPGRFPPAVVQIEKACALAGKLAHIYSIKRDEINTHAVWAFIDGYGINSKDREARWDLWLPSWENEKNLTQVMKDKTLWYKEQFHLHVDDSDNMYEKTVIDLANGDRLHLPSIFRLSMEAHIITKNHRRFINSWPGSFKDGVEEHYKISASATEYKMIRNEPWCFSGKGGCYFGQEKKGEKPSEVEEGWYISFNWKEIPQRGTKFIIKNPVNGRKVVAIAGYDTGTVCTGELPGGVCEEIHHYMGTTHGSKLEIGLARDQNLSPGPVCHKQKVRFLEQDALPLLL